MIPKGKNVKRKLLFLAALLLPLAAFPASEYPEGAQWLPGRLLVNFAESVGEVQSMDRLDGKLSLKNTNVDALFERFDVLSIKRVSPDGVLRKMPVAPDAERLVVVSFPESFDVLTVLDAFLTLPEVVDAEPDMLMKSYDTVPNDIMWNQQCDKEVMGCPVAWDYSHGSRELLAVAVDIGFWWPHPDAYDNLWVNPGEDLNHDGLPYSFDDYPGDLEDLNAVDDDGNGLPDDFIAWDFVDVGSGGVQGEDVSVQDNDPTSLDNHGSHVLGIIGAVGNNEIGIAGVCWNLTIMASRAGYLTPDGGVVVTSAAAACINWAVAHGVNLINMSYGGPTFSNVTNNAVQAAWASGALLCAASGNEGVTTIQYPCGYSNVVCVGATDCNDVVADFSNRGTHVSCYAPGVNIRSLSVNNGYASLDGTSMASPNATGVFALVWSVFPDLNNGQLRDIVLQNCDDLTELNSDINPSYLGFGRVNAAKAISGLLPNLSVEATAISGDNDGDGRLEANETGTLSLRVSNLDGWFPAVGVGVTVASDDPNLSLNGTTYTIDNLSGGQSVELTNGSATVTCGSNVPLAYTSTLEVVFNLGNGAFLTRTAALRVGRAATLVVDDDNGTNYANFFATALNADGYNFDEFSTLDAPLTSTDLMEYDHVIWACGNEDSSTLTQSDRDLLQTFMNNGGNLMLVGQGIDEDPDVVGSPFYSNYLHTASGGASGGTQVNGVSGDVVSNGSSLILIGGGCGGNGNISPSVLDAVDGGVVFYTYASNSLGGAVRYDNGTYKSAYFGFALEAACGAAGTEHHRVVVRRVLDWFGAVSGVEDDPEVIPANYKISPAYPNPFNPSAAVSVELQHRSHVRATLHDLLGRQVQVIADRDVNAGVHTLEINGESLPSGSYWLSVSVDHHMNTQRVILLK